MEVFLYTGVDRDPSSWWLTKVSRKKSDPFNSFSMVNLMGLGSTMLRWSKKCDRLGLLVEQWTCHPEGVWAGGECSFLHILHDKVCH